MATALSDQRRSLQQEIASVLEKGPHRADPLPVAPKADPRAQPSAGAKPAADSGARLPNFPDWRAEQTAAQADAKRELMSFDFGTVVPQREDASAKALAAEAKPATETLAPKVDADKPETAEEFARIAVACWIEQQCRARSQWYRSAQRRGFPAVVARAGQAGRRCVCAGC